MTMIKTIRNYSLHGDNLLNFYLIFMQHALKAFMLFICTVLTYPVL